jgi:hypothetical protein
MAIEKSGAVRKTLTRVLAAGALLAVYAVSTVATSGVFLASTTTAANAQRGRGRGGGWGRGRGGWGRGRGGWGRGRGWGAWCHRPWSSRRYYCF